MKRTIALLTTLCCTLLLAAQQPMAELQGEFADGRTMVLPAGLKGRPAVIGLAFGKAAQGQLESWYEPAYLRFVAKHGLFAGSSNAQVLFVPLFVGLNKAAYEPSLKQFRKSATPEVADLVLFCKVENDVRQALGLERENTAYFLVLDAEGRIVHREQGAYALQKLDALEEALW
ncbi:MAG: hypothetical protein JNM31_06420 [Flavobacteriales bacterium]|nr:hypothetical protein [Flavobacteriales bacterium]